MLILNAIYKINKYKFPLFIITDITALNISFYVGFAFIKFEHTSDYVWVLKQLKELYNELDISYPDVLLTNASNALINIYTTIFLETSHILYI